MGGSQGVVMTGESMSIMSPTGAGLMYTQQLPLPGAVFTTGGTGERSDVHISVGLYLCLSGCMCVLSQILLTEVPKRG